MNDRITPRTLKGFRDFLPELALAREQMIDTAKAVYRRYGYSPIDTPALEYSEILLGKGSDETDRQTYRFEDHGGRDIALRFDLTVPLARFVAQHAGELGMPFKRYHVGTVWRGERPQRGRYREFMQCDFDTIGTESIVADIETVLVIDDMFRSLGFEQFTIRVNNRRLLNGVLERVGLDGQATAVLRALDKLAKIGPEGVRAELEREVGAAADQIDAVLGLSGLRGDNTEILAALPELVGDSEVGRRGVEELRDLLAGVGAAGVADRVRLDVSIARGLDYYTGTVVETFLDALPAIGSVCSGGRYDDLASRYTKQRLPGIGASLGVDRTLAAMEELGMIERRAASAPVLLTLFDADLVERHLALAAELRRAGIGVELYPEPRKLGAQLKYADRRGHRIALIAGPHEWERDAVQVKILETGASREVARSQLAETLRDLLDT